MNKTNLNKPIRFELVDEPEKTLGDVILDNISELLACKRCRTELVCEGEELCDFCIDDIVNDEGD